MRPSTEPVSPPRPLALALTAHPEPRSFCSAVGDRVVQAAEAAGYRLCRHDLYRSRFDPVLTVEEYRRGFSLDTATQTAVKELQEAEQIIIVHPDWWGGPPAILKGWIDRVLRAGIAFEYRGPDIGPKNRVGLLSTKQVLVLVTTDSDAAEDHQSLRQYWSRNVFGFCGVPNTDVRVIGPVHGSRPGTRKRWLKDVENLSFSGAGKASMGLSAEDDLETR